MTSMRGNMSAAVPTVVNPSEGYRLWSRTYDSDPNPIVNLEQRTLMALLADVEGKVFLDIACGTGRWMMIAAARGARAFGVDLSPEMLALARKKPRLDGCVVQGDACRLPFMDERADLVVCSFAVGYIKQLISLFRDLSRVARRGGTVIVSDLHPRGLNAGWRRTFRNASGLFEIENHPHASTELLEAGRKADLRLGGILEPCFGEPELAILSCAGKHEQDDIRNVPAVLITVWQRP